MRLSPRHRCGDLDPVLREGLAHLFREQVRVVIDEQQMGHDALPWRTPAEYAGWLPGIVFAILKVGPAQIEMEARSFSTAIRRRRRKRRGPSRFREILMNPRRRSRLIAYGVAVAVPAVSLLVRLLIPPGVPQELALYFTFFPAVVIAAYLGGFRPGMLATVLSAVAIDYFFVEPRCSLRIEHTHDAVAVALFVLVGAFISCLCESLLRSRPASRPASAATRSRWRASATRSSRPTSRRG